MNRRNLLTILGATLVALRLEKLLAQSPGDAGSNGLPREVDEWLRAVLDTIVPADHDPGAVDSGILKDLVPMLRESTRRGQLYRRGYALLEQISRDRFGVAFASLASDTKQSIFEEMLEADTAESGIPREGYMFAQLARVDVLKLFYASRAGQRTVGYRPPVDGYLALANELDKAEGAARTDGVN